MKNNNFIDVFVALLVCIIIAIITTVIISIVKYTPCPKITHRYSYGDEVKIISGFYKNAVKTIIVEKRMWRKNGEKCMQLGYIANVYKGDEKTEARVYESEIISK